MARKSVRIPDFDAPFITLPTNNSVLSSRYQGVDLTPELWLVKLLM